MLLLFVLLLQVNAKIISDSRIHPEYKKNQAVLVIADPHIEFNREPDRIAFLERVVNFANLNKEYLRIGAVIVAGDLGQPYEAKRILNHLIVPWLVTPGDNDVRFMREPANNEFYTEFHDQLLKLERDQKYSYLTFVAGDYLRDPEDHDIEGFKYNFLIYVDGVRYLTADWVRRYWVAGKPVEWGDYTKKTGSWIEWTLGHSNEVYGIKVLYQNNIIQHQPAINKDEIFITNSAQTLWQKNTIAYPGDIVGTYRDNGDKLGNVFSGHLHVGGCLKTDKVAGYKNYSLKASHYALPDNSLVDKLTKLLGDEIAYYPKDASIAYLLSPSTTLTYKKHAIFPLWEEEGDRVKVHSGKVGDDWIYVEDEYEYFTLNEGKNKLICYTPDYYTIKTSIRELHCRTEGWGSSNDAEIQKKIDDHALLSAIDIEDVFGCEKCGPRYDGKNEFGAKILGIIVPDDQSYYPQSGGVLECKLHLENSKGDIVEYEIPAKYEVRKVKESLLCPQLGDIKYYISIKDGTEIWSEGAGISSGWYKDWPSGLTLIYDGTYDAAMQGRGHIDITLTFPEQPMYDEYTISMELAPYNSGAVKFSTNSIKE